MRRVWWCAVALLLASAAAFTVDCDRDYADCDKELSKITEEDDQATDSPPEPASKAVPTTSIAEASIEEIPKRELPKELLITTDSVTPKINGTNVPKGRLLNLSVDELQPFANSLHNKTAEKLEPRTKKHMPDLSDVSLDADDDFDFSPHDVKTEDSRILHKGLRDDLNGEVRSESDAEKGFDEVVICSENGIRYKIGEKIERGCEEVCQCQAHEAWQCEPRCQVPYIRHGRRIADPLCYETPVDDCCSIIACAAGTGSDLKEAASTHTKAEVCRYGNSSYTPGQTWEVGCEQTCSCALDAVVTCKPRCVALSASEHCINVQDPHDSCCKVQVCDVTHDAHEHIEPPPPTASHATIENRMDSDLNDLLVSVTEASTVEPKRLIEPISSITVLKNNSVLINLMHSNSSDGRIHLRISRDGGKTFQDIKMDSANMLQNLDPGLSYILKSENTGKTFDFKIPAGDVGVNDIQDSNSIAPENNTMGCVSEGVQYNVGDEFRIGCSELCECVGAGQRECAALECPSHVGLELISSTCVRWAPDPPDWVPRPPACCPTKMRCLSDGSCDYHGHKIPNWSEVPESLTGCELRCFCESGTLDCQNICSPLPALPPQTLRCQPGFKPAPVNISEDDCCKQWGCAPTGSASGFTKPPGKQLPAFVPTIPPEIHFPTEDDLGDFGQNNDIHRQQGPPRAPPPFKLPSLLPPGGAEPVDNQKLTLMSLVSDSPTSVKILFELSPVLVGLRGSVDLRYTDKEDDDITHWYSQVFAPTDEVLTTARLEFRLTGLKPATLYRLRGKLYLHSLPLEPVSGVFTVRTQDAPLMMEEKRRAVETGLRVQYVNATTAQLSWRHFTEDELQYIDGIQVRYRRLEQPIYSMTELLHHGREAAALPELRPGARYEAALVLVPPPRSPVELYDPATVNFTTPEFYDMYNWSVTVEVPKVGAESLEVRWRGVPAPPERYVRVYRGAYSCDDNSTTTHALREHATFQLADRYQPPSLLLTGLQPDTKCRVWLELFLTNGKVKISNVLDVTTKSEDSENTIDNEVQASSVAGSRSGAHGDYYSALVVVGVVAALGTLTSLLLLLVVMRRHRPHSVSITTVPSAPRGPALPPYDNPAYKLELQQETMDL